MAITGSGADRRPYAARPAPLLYDREAGGLPRGAVVEGVIGDLDLESVQSRGERRGVERQVLRPHAAARMRNRPLERQRDEAGLLLDPDQALKAAEELLDRAPVEPLGPDRVIDPEGHLPGVIALQVVRLEVEIERLVPQEAAGRKREDR